ncbi:Metabotropic glutamate receptor 3, partial [Argonauta hians]
ITGRPFKPVLVVLLMLMLCPPSPHAAMRVNRCSEDHTNATVQPYGQAFIVGVFSFHNKGDSGKYGCGDTNTVSMQSYEAIRWTLELLNKKEEYFNGQYLKDTYVPGIRLGMITKDYCDQTNHVTALLQDAIEEIDTNNCNLSLSQSKMFLGVIGASSDAATLRLAEYTTRHQIPLVSYIASASRLTDGSKYPYVVRTVPAQTPRLSVLVEVLEKLAWDFVTVVYTDDPSTRQTFMELRERMTQRDLCLTAAINTPSGDVSTATMETVLSRVKGAESKGVVFLGSEPVARKLFQVANTYPGAGDLQWVLTDSLSLARNYTDNKYIRGVVAVLTGTRFIVEFEDHWKRLDESNPSSENPWLMEWYMAQNKCKFPGVIRSPFNQYPDCVLLSEDEKRSRFVQDQYVEPAVHAVFTYAQALKTAQSALCGNIAGACQALMALSSKDFAEQYLKKVSFTYKTDERISSLASDRYAPYQKAKQLKFDANGNVVNPEFGVWNYNNKMAVSRFRFTNVGSYSQGTLSFDKSKVEMYDKDRTSKLPALPTSPCPNATCRPCLDSFADVTYFFRDGDVVLTSFFSLHNKGDSPFNCGSFATDHSQMQHFQAVLYAIENLQKRYPALLRSVKLGYLMLDDCSSHHSAVSLISDIQHGRLKVLDPLTRSQLDPRKIIGYLGMSDSRLTQHLASLMNTLKRPLIGYTPMSYQMDPSNNKYPYYLSPLQLHASLMRSLSQFLRNVGWKYIQILYSEDSYGENGRNEMIKEAARYGICVVASYSVDKLKESNSFIEALRRNPNAKPVVVIVSKKKSIQRILQGIRYGSAAGEFTFIGLGSWGTSENLVKGFEEEADGTLIFRYKTAEIENFHNYLETLSGQSHANNPWFIEWFESLFKCSLRPAYVLKHGSLCPDETIKLKITDSPRFELDPRTSFTVDAVYAFAFGLHGALIDMCGQNYVIACSKFLTSRDTGKILVENIREARFTDENQHDFFFDQNGLGNFPIEVYNYNSKKYDKMSDYSLSDAVFNLNENSLKLYGGAAVTSVRPTCDGQCITCQYLSSELPVMYLPGDILIAAIFDVHNSGVSPFRCGPLRVYGGFQNTEAFAFALDWVNRGMLSDVVLRGNVILGGIGLDGCSNSARAKSLIYNFHHGLLNTSKAMLPDEGKISETVGWLSYGSGSTKDMAPIVQDYSVALVSPGATSTDLLNKNRYPTFFRTIPSDRRTLQAMVDMVEKLGFSYVITLNSPDVGQREARREFERLARLREVCIAASYEFDTDGSYKDIIYHIIRSTTRVVVVFSEADDHIVGLLTAKTNIQVAQDIVFLSNRPWHPTLKLPASIYEKSIMFQTQFPIVDQFKKWLDQKRPNNNNNNNNTNPWFNEYFENYYGCFIGKNCTGYQSVVDRRYQQNRQVVPTMNAVFSLAKGVQMTLQEKCGPQYTDVCDRFRTDPDTRQMIMSNMDKMAFTTVDGSRFRFDDREVEASVNVIQIHNGAVRPIAEYSGKSLQYLVNEEKLVNDYKLVPSVCVSSCSRCERSSNIDSQFVFTPGDFTLVGLFDIHKKGSNPYHCGAINDKQGFQLVEAFNYAVDYVNSGQGIFANILDGVTLGSLAVDVCQSPTKAGNLVTNLQSKNLRLIDNTTNILVEPTDFQVYVGPFDSESSIRVADILTRLGIPQISYGATSSELSQERFPFFSRTVPSDKKQARAIVSFLKRYQIDKVQVISTEDTVGRFGRQEFAKVAFDNKICITQNISLPRNEFLSEADTDSAISKLTQQKFSTAVIIFVTNPRLLLVSIENHFNVTSEFLFIATDKWGADKDMLQGLNKTLSKPSRLVIFDVETADLPGFDKYLDSKSKRGAINNNWFDEYYENLYKCSLTSSSKFPVPCDGAGYRTLPKASHYIQDPYVLYVVNAVFAAAVGIHKALQEVCGITYNDVCQRFSSSDQRPLIQKGITESLFTDPTLQPFYYLQGTDDSIRGYHIYQPAQGKGQEHGYINVGSYNDTDNLKLDARYKLAWSPPSCSTSGSGGSTSQCPQCDFPESEPSQFMIQKSSNDLNLVAFFDVHSADNKVPNRCGELNVVSGFQHALAFFYAINKVNKNGRNRLDSSLQLGGVAMDTCSLPMTIGPDVYSLLTGNSICPNPQGHTAGSNGMVVPPNSILAFLPKSSSNALPVATMLRQYDSLTLSPSASTTKLDDRFLYPRFLRTVPPDNLQARAIIDVLKKMQWTYVSGVYSNNEYGTGAMKTFLEVATSDQAICVTKVASLSLNMTLDGAKSIVQRLNSEAGARAVIVFAIEHHIRLLLEATKDLNLVNRFVWVGSDTWGSKNFVVSNGLQEPAAGAITMQIHSHSLEGFKNYMKGLTLENHDGIPDDWFYEFYQHIHQCRLLFMKSAKNYDRICSKDEKFTDDKMQEDPFLFHTVLAVEMIAIGINNIEQCGKDSNTETLATCLSYLQNRSSILYESVLKSQWLDLHKNSSSSNNSSQDIPPYFSFKFTDSGNGQLGYDILNYRFDIYNNKYDYVKIGSWQNTLSLDAMKYRGARYADIAIIPQSQCPTGSTCECLNADGKRVKQTAKQQSASSLVSGRDQIYIDPETGAFVSIRSAPSPNARFFTLWGTIVTTLAALGAFFSFCLFCYFLIFYPYRGGTSVLGFTLIIAIIGLYLMVLPFVFHATPVVCSIRRVFLGVFYSLAYSVMVVKLLDAYRNVNKEELKYKKLARPCALLLFALSFVAVQLMIAIQWLILQPPDVVNVPVSGMLYPRCAPHDFSDEALVISLVFAMLLLVSCLLIGLSTWNNPNNCYESQWILGMAFLHIPVWIIWCVISTVVIYDLRDIAVAGGLLVNATILLALGPLYRFKLMKKDKAMQQEEKDDYYLYDTGVHDDVFYGNGYNTAPRIRDYPAFNH